MTPTLVGVDPGRTGAAVWLGDDGRTVLRVQRWRDLDDPPVLEVTAPALVAVEAQYVGRGAHASLRLAEWTGGLVSRLPPGVEVLRPVAATWRAAVLRVGRVRRADAKRHALTAALYSLGEPLETVDACEAWCLARYAWGVWRARAVVER